MLAVPLFGIVIDDFVSVRIVARSADPRTSVAAALHAKAQHAYSCGSLEGSPEKDILGSDRFQATGAEIDASNKTLSESIVSCGAPISTRIALASLSLRAAVLPIASSKLAARLSGAWVAVSLYRRCMMVIFSELFAVGQNVDKASPSQRAFPQTRRMAQELVLASVLSVFSSSDLSAPTLPTVFATDASLGRGATCSAVLQKDTAQVGGIL